MSNDVQPVTSPSPNSSSSDFNFPPNFSFPPFFTLQPNLTTLSSQLSLWSTLVQDYCSHHRIFQLSLSAACAPSPSSTLFHNTDISRRLDLISARRVVEFMTSAEGDYRAEWISDGKKGSERKDAAWIFWRKTDEWADVVYSWVDGTAQKGTVFTLLELRCGDQNHDEEEGKEVGLEWKGMDEGLFRKCIDVLVKRGKAQVFTGSDGRGEGVKII